MSFKEGKIIDRMKLDDGREVIIRYIKSGDAAGIALLSKSLAQEGAFLGGKPATLNEKRKEVSGYIKNARRKRGISLVLESGKKIIGNAGGTCGRGTSGHVIDIGIVIHKSFRGLGLGEKTMRLLMGLAKNDLKSEIVKLRCYDKNKIALNLYRKMGFEEVGRIRNGLKLNGRYYSDVIMVKYI